MTATTTHARARGRGPAAPPNRRRRPVWDEEPTLPGRLAKAVLLTGVLLAVLVPLYVVVLTSLSPQRAITDAGGLVLVPHGFSVAAYEEILSGGVVTRAALVSTGITVVGTLFSLTVTVLAAYGLSRPDSFGHRPLLFVVLVTFLFGPGIIPSYLLVRSLGLLDSYGSLILPTAVAAFNLVVLRGFYLNIPRDLLDSARIDGAGEFRILTRIVLPLSRAVTAVIALFYAVGYWNAFFNAFLYLSDNNKWPIQLVLRSYVLQGQPMPQGSASGSIATVVPGLAVKMAVIVLTVVPVLLVVPFVQRHFTKGVIIGAIKG